MTRLEFARQLLAAGVSVFRIPLGTKVPDTPWKPFQDHYATDDELVAWFTTPANIGVVTGALSGLVVIDADTPEAVTYLAGRIPYTPWQSRTARGAHFWFTHPGFPVANRGTDVHTPAGPLPVHVRGDGGYVLAPGSLHPSGTPYRLAGDWTQPRTALPRFWPNWLETTKPPRRKTGAPHAPPPLTGDAFLLERARRYLGAIPPPVIGCGSDALTLKAACRLVRGFGLSDTDAESLLWDWCGNRAGWTRDWVAEKVANAGRYGKEAIGGLR